MGHHQERDMPVPTVPVTHLVLIKACLALAFLNTLFNGVTGGATWANLSNGVSAGAFDMSRRSPWGRCSERRTSNQPSGPGNWSRLSTTR